MPWLDLPFTEIDVQEVYKRDSNLKKEDVQVLMTWIQSEPHLPLITELQVLLFLHSNYYNVQLVKKAIDTYFTIKTNSSDIYGSRTLKDPILNEAARSLVIAPLSTVTPTGDTIILGRLVDFNASNYTAVGHIRLFDVCTLLYLHQNGPANGIQIIADVDHSTFGHFMKYGPTIIRKFLNYFTDAIPIRLKYIHVLHVAYFVEKLIAMLKPMMQKELFDCIKIHSNIESLYQYVPKDLLPEDYGGTSESTEILQEKIIKLIESSEQFLMFQDSQLVNESKRSKLIKVTSHASRIQVTKSLQLENTK